MSQTEKAIKKLSTGVNAQVVLNLPVDQVIADPNQPRKFFDEDKLKGLAQSIEKTGQDTPISVYDNGEMYVIISGERRWRACHFTTNKIVRAIQVTEPENISLLRVKQIVENIQREEFKPIDLANAYALLLVDNGGTYQSITALAADLGVSEASVQRTLKLLSMSDDIQDLVATGVSGVDAAHDLHAIKKADEGAANTLIEEAKETGILERKKTRQVKENLNLKRDMGRKKTEHSDLKTKLNYAIDSLNKNELNVVISLLKEALKECENLVKNQE